jgi:hypothetical protein
MNNKNKIVLVLVAVIFLASGYFLGSRNKNINSIENGITTVSTTTDDSIGTTTKTSVVKNTNQNNTAPYSVIAKIGQRTYSNGVYFTLGKTIYDGRCPKDVKCIQVGSVDVGILLESNGLSQNTIITLGKPFLFAGKVVTLVSVSPVKVSTKTILEGDYRFGVTVKNR